MAGYLRLTSLLLAGARHNSMGCWGTRYVHSIRRMAKLAASTHVLHLYALNGSYHLMFAVKLSSVDFHMLRNLLEDFGQRSAVAQVC